MMKKIFLLNLIFLSLPVHSANWKKFTVTVPTASTGTAGTALTSAQCPTNYIFVPKNTTFIASDFCVAKYEMKNDGYGTPTSVAAGVPWISIDRATARAKCQSLGAGYDMISNEQWQTIANNVAGVAANWSNGVAYGSGQLSRGHSDNSPASPIAAGADDTAANCSGTGQTCSSTVWDSQRRTLTLSNGNVIWDFAGNAWEWVTNNTSASNGADSYISAITPLSDSRQLRFGTTAVCTTGASSTPWCGMGYGEFNYNGGAIVRGGSFSWGLQTGVFATSLDALASASVGDLGFRCVFSH